MYATLSFGQRNNTLNTLFLLEACRGAEEDGGAIVVIVTVSEHIATPCVEVTVIVMMPVDPSVK